MQRIVQNHENGPAQNTFKTDITQNCFDQKNKEYCKYSFQNY